MKEMLLLLVSTALVNNVVLSQFLGICPFLGVSKKTKTAVGMGSAVIFVVTVASAVASLIYNFILIPCELEYMKTIVFIAVIAALVQLVEMILKKFIPSLYKALGVYLPLITTNCIVLGLAILNVNLGHGLLEVLVYSLGAGAGFTLVLVLFAAMRERINNANTPAPFRGSAIALITAGLLSMAFMGFTGIIQQ